MPIAILQAATDKSTDGALRLGLILLSGGIVLVLFACAFIAVVVANQRRKKLAREEKLRALQEREEKYSDLFNNVTDIVFIHSLDGTILEINASAAAAFKSSVDAFIGKSLQQLFGPRYYSRINRYLAEVSENGVANGTFHLVLDNGMHRYFEYRNSLIRKNEQSVAVRGIVRDITQQRLTEKQLRESEKRFRHLVKYSPLPMLVHVDRTIIYANEAALKLLGAGDYQKILGASIDSFILVDILNPDEAMFLVQSSGASPKILNERIRLLNGEVRDVETASLPVIFDGMRAVHVVIRDITESKQLQDTLREIPGQIIKAQETERKRVARDLHDGVIQILGSVKFRLQMSEEELANLTPELKPVLPQLGSDLENAIEEIRRISHDLRPSILDDLGLYAAVSKLTKDFRSRTRIEVEYNQPETPGRLSPEVEICLFRIIQEALNNAEKYSQASTICVEINSSEQFVEAMILDNGVGFSSSAPRQNSPAGGRKWGGLGLTTMKERATALGGNVVVESQLTKGTRVAVKIPVGEMKRSHNLEGGSPS